MFININLPKHQVKMVHENGVIVVLDLTTTPELEREGYAQELAHEINGLRRKLGCEVNDVIEVHLLSKTLDIYSITSEYKELIESQANCIVNPTVQDEGGRTAHTIQVRDHEVLAIIRLGSVATAGKANDPENR